MPKSKKGLPKISKVNTHYASRRKPPLYGMEARQSLSSVPIASTSTSNQYEVLSDMEDEEIPCQPTEANLPRKTRIPPIVITQNGFNVNSLNPIKVDGMTFKYISIGIKINFPELESYDQCLQYLKRENIEFYTHRRRNTNFKVILAGLPQTDPEVIKQELLSNHNLVTTDIQELKTSYYNVHSRLYLVSFGVGDVNLHHLNRVKSINQVIVKWMRYTRKFKGTTQCRRCLMFGHGQENCFRKIMCMLCANTTHVAENCTFNNASDNQLIVFKCGNCHAKGLPSNHKANDSSCPCKSEFESIRNRFSNQNQRNTNHRSSLQSTLNRNAREFVFQENGFPTLPNNRRSQINSEVTRRQTSLNLPMKNNGNRSSSGPSGVNSDASYSNATKRGKLLSIDEFFNIFEDALDKFYACESAADQFGLIVSLLRRAAHLNG